MFFFNFKTKNVNTFSVIAQHARVRHPTSHSVIVKQWFVKTLKRPVGVIYNKLRIFVEKIIAVFSEIMCIKNAVLYVLW